VDYNGDDASKSQAQTTAVLQRDKDLAGIFGTNVFSAEGAGTAVVNAGLKGAVQVVAFDATTDAIQKLKDGVVTLVIAQKPYDMGFLATFYAMANARGVSSIPSVFQQDMRSSIARMSLIQPFHVSFTSNALGTSARF